MTTTNDNNQCMSMITIKNMNNIKKEKINERESCQKSYTARNDGGPLLLNSILTLISDLRYLISIPSTHSQCSITAPISRPPNFT